MENGGYKVLMTTVKSNESDDWIFVTKIHGVVETVPGQVEQKYKIFHYSVQNQLLYQGITYWNIAYSQLTVKQFNCGL